MVPHQRVVAHADPNWVSRITGVMKRATSFEGASLPKLGVCGFTVPASKSKPRRP